MFTDQKKNLWLIDHLKKKLQLCSLDLYKHDLEYISVSLASSLSVTFSNSFCESVQMILWNHMMCLGWGKKSSTLIFLQLSFKCSKTC